MADTEMRELIEGFEVFIEEAENKALGKKFESMSMKEYLDMVGKSWKELDLATVRENINSVWVARKDTGELPVPFPSDYFLNVSVIDQSLKGDKYV